MAGIVKSERAGAGAGAGGSHNAVVGGDSSSKLKSASCDMRFRDYSCAPVVNGKIALVALGCLGDYMFCLRIGTENYPLAKFNINEVAKNFIPGLDEGKKFLTFPGKKVLPNSSQVISIFRKEIAPYADFPNISKWGTRGDMPELLFKICMVACKVIDKCSVLRLRKSKQFPLDIYAVGDRCYVTLSTTFDPDLNLIRGGGEKEIRNALRFDLGNMKVTLCVEKRLRERYSLNYKAAEQFLFGNRVGCNCKVLEPAGSVLVRKVVRTMPVFSIFSKRAYSDLLDFAREIADYPLGKKEAVFLEVVSQLLSVLKILHKSGRAHKDIKPDNFLIYRDSSNKHGFKILFTDNNHCTLIENPEVKSGGHECVGSDQYVSYKKLLRGGEPCFDDGDLAEDVYSLGITLYELLNHIKPTFSKDILMEVLELLRCMTLSSFLMDKNPLAKIKAAFNNCGLSPMAYEHFKYFYITVWCERTSGDKLVPLVFEEGQQYIRMTSTEALEYYKSYVRPTIDKLTSGGVEKDKK